MRINFPKFSLAFAAAIALAISGAAFAGGSHESSGTDVHGEGKSQGHGHGGGVEFGKPGKSFEVNRTIEITMDDDYFEPKKLVIRAGETIRFVIKNEGEFLHEFSIGTAAMHAEHRKEMMTMMEKGMSSQGHDDPNSILIEPGKTKKLVWKFAAASNLEFACNIPGHYEAGMMGKFELGAKRRPIIGS